MSSPSSLPIDLKALPLSERIQLVEDLWDSIAEESPPLQLLPDDQAELESRFVGHVQDPQSSVPWDVVRARLLGAAH